MAVPETHDIEVPRPGFTVGADDVGGVEDVPVAGALDVEVVAGGGVYDLYPLSLKAAQQHAASLVDVGSGRVLTDERIRRHHQVDVTQAHCDCLPYRPLLR